MNTLIVIALGGACGAVLRFLVSSGIYQWLGRGFPYGTLVVNVLGSFLIGLLTQTLILQRVALSMEYRSAILVGLLGSFTTFSTFSLETFTLVEQGQNSKAILNVLTSFSACLLAVGLGVFLGRILVNYSETVSNFFGWPFPHTVVVINMFGAFLIGFFSILLMSKTALSDVQRTGLLVMTIGLFMTLSSFYMVLHLLEQGHRFEKELTMIFTIFSVNTLFCGLALTAGLWTARQL